MPGMRFVLTVLIAVSANLTGGAQFASPAHAEPLSSLISAEANTATETAPAGPQSAPAAGSSASPSERPAPPSLGGGSGEDPPVSPGCRPRNNKKLELIV